MVDPVGPASPAKKAKSRLFKGVEESVRSSLSTWSKEALVRLAMGLAVHRVRSGQDPLGLTAYSVTKRTAAELVALISNLCAEPDTHQMVVILMQMSVPGIT